MNRHRRVRLGAASTILAAVAGAYGVDFARPSLAQSSVAPAGAVSYAGDDGASFAQAILVINRLGLSEDNLLWLHI